MIEIYTIIDKIKEDNKILHSSNRIEKNIMESIIVLVAEHYGIDTKKFFQDEKLNYKKIIMSNIFKQFKDLNNGIWYDEHIIPLVYEYLVKQKDKKHKYSIYYTPQWIVKYIVDESLRDLLNRKEITNIRILEPSCGCGMFLLYVFDVLYEWYCNNTKLDKYSIITEITNNILYGVDIDKDGIRYCKYALLFKCIKIMGSYEKLNFNLYNYDYLKNQYFNSMKFDLVIGNPPYLENRRINKYFDKQYLKEHFNTAKGRFDLFSLFIEKSIRLIKENGKIGFILPASLLSNNNFTYIRKFILEHCNIIEIINIGENIFNNVGMNMAIIIVEKVLTRDNSHKVKCKNIANSNNPKEELLFSDYKKISQVYYYDLLNQVFDINSTPVTFELRKKVNLNSCKINDVCEIIAGIATGNIRKKLISYDNYHSKSKRILEGKNITRYNYNWEGLYIKDDKSIIDKSIGEYATFMRKEFIFSPKLLIRQTADRFVCAYDNQNYYLLNTLYSLIIRKEYVDMIDIKYVLALLNSKFYSFLYRTLIRENGKLFPQLKIFHIQQSPFKIISIKQQNEFIIYVNKIINLKEKLNSCDTLSEIENKDIISEICLYENKIDLMVYKLYKLTDEEIQEVEQEMS